MMLILIAPLVSCNASTINIVDTDSYSFVYNYGNAKIWVFVMLNHPFLIGPEVNNSIFLTVYLEKLGSNRGVFLNRLTLSFEGTQVRKAISPNVTLGNDLRLWTWNITFGQEDIDLILLLGQYLFATTLDFEFRYDIIDSSEEYWFYRVNESIPATIQRQGQAADTWITFGTIFLIVSLFGVASAILVLWLKIRRYRRTSLSTKEKTDISTT